MIRRSVSALILAVCSVAPVVSHASMFGHTAGTASAKVKMVKMTLKNSSSAPMELLIEDKPVTLAANEEYKVNVPEGTHVYGADKSVKIVVTRDLDGTMASFR